jgi:hypothetical protein
MSSFIPISIDVVGRRNVVRWIERPDTFAPQPFFAQMVRERLASGVPQRVTLLDILLTAQGPDPRGLVMHLSRCGSTLLMQSLAHAGCIAPISEATPVNQLLARFDIPEQERAGLLRGLIRALGPRDPASSELPSLVKFTSWNVLFFDILRAAFPDTPWLFLYREPLETMASHEAHPAKWLADDRFFARLTGVHRLPSLAGLDQQRRCAAVLAAYGQAALDASPAPTNLLNYNQLPAALSADVPARFRVPTSAMQQERIADASRIYSKDVSRRVVFDPDDERRARCVTDRLREADLEYTRTVHAALERRRTGAAGHS